MAYKYYSRCHLDYLRCWLATNGSSKSLDSLMSYTCKRCSMHMSKESISSMLFAASTNRPFGGGS